MDKKIIIWGIVLLLLIGGAFALGLRPAKTSVDFAPNMIKEGEFWVVNNDGLYLEVDIHTEGELGEYIELDQKKLIFKEDEDAKKVSFRVKMPEKLPAGEVKANLVVEEVLSEGESPYEFTARLVLKHKIMVKSPYPPKFVEGKLTFEDNEDKMGLVSEVKNLGSETIEKIRTRFYVNDRQAEVGAAESPEDRLEPGESKMLRAEIDRKKVSYGEFDVLAAIFYDDYKLELEKKLIVGEPEIEILYFDRYFIFGKINKFTLDLLNKWNRKLEDVFVDIFVFKEGKQVDALKTASFELEGGEMKKVEGYFDATNKEVGDYEFEVVVDYGTRKSHQKFEGSVLEEEAYEEAKKEKGILTYVLTGLLFGLVVVIFSVLLLRKRPSLPAGPGLGEEIRLENKRENVQEKKKETLEKIGEREKAAGVIEKEKREKWNYTQRNVFDRMKYNGK